MVDLLIQAIFLTAANYLLVLYLTDITVDGPFNAFAKLRAWAGIELVYMDDVDSGESELVDSEHDGSFLARVLDCHRCTTPYTTAGLIVLSLALGFLPLSWSLIILWLSISGATVYLFEFAN